MTMAREEGSTSKRGNGIVGVLREVHNKWERRAPVTPAHCARLLNAEHGVKRILVQPCTKRIFPDAQYEEVGCEITPDLSDCGLLLGIKRPEELLPERSYAFFSHTHKIQPENMSVLDQVLEKRISLYDYELILGEHGERLVAFGQYAGLAGMIDLLRGLGERFLSQGFSTPFLSLGSSYMYTSLKEAKQAVLAVGEEIKNAGLPLGICPLIFVFTGTGNVSQGAQEMFRLLPHMFVEPSELQSLVVPGASMSQASDLQQRARGARVGKSQFQVYGTVVLPQHMVEPIDSLKQFDKADYYAHPDQYRSVFAKTIAPYASVIVNCMYWERRFPRLLTNDELRELHSKKMCRLLAVGDITCDIGGSIECVREITAIESPFLRYDPEMGEIHKDMNGEGIIFLAVDCVPTELPKEATKHFGDVLYPFLGSMAHASSPEENLVPIQNACIAHNGKLRPLYEYIHRMRQSQDTMKKQQTAKMNGEKNDQLVRVVSLSGHLFDQYLINEALDVICDGGGRFQVATFKVGQSDAETSHADLQVEADSEEALNGIVDKLAVIAREGRNKQYCNGHAVYSRKTKQSLLQKLKDRGSTGGPQVLILGAGRMCEPAVKYLSDGQFITPRNLQQPVHVRVGVVVASLYLSDAEKVVEGIPNATAAQLDVSDGAQLRELISEANVVISLLPANCHVAVANACIELKKHLVTASYVSTEMDNLNEKAKRAGVTLLCEMGLDPGIDHMLAMKMIDKAHARGGRVQSFVSYCGGLPAPTAANNPLGYKFSWNPSGAIKAGRNPAVYLYQGKKVEVAGEDLFASAVPLRLQNTPAFALERLPNRDSLSYGDLYGITNEAATVFRATLRYEGFSEIMAALGKIGFFKMDPLMITANDAPSSGLTYKAVLELLLSQFPEHPRQFSASETNTVSSNTSWIANKLTSLGCCKDSSVAFKAANCIRWLGLDAEESIPEACKNAFDVLCHRMEQRLTYAPNEQDMVLLHHELEVVFDDGHPSEKHTATLLELGETSEQGTELLVRPQSAMARTVGLPVAIAAQLLLFEDVILRGVLRPLHSEIYQPALAILTALGIKVEEHVEKF